MPLVPKIHQAPGGTHGRASPYQPTPQTGKFGETRGNPPAGVTEEDWMKAYNRADSQIYKSVKKEDWIAARGTGETRDGAIDDLIMRGMLAFNFQDTNP
jgi:hypothetical protein